MSYLIEIADYDLQVFTKVNPDVSGLDFEKKFESKTFTTRKYPNGDVLFFGADYDLIFSYASDKIAYTIYENGELLSSGFFMRTGQRDITNKRWVAELVLDDFFLPFEEKGDNEYNILEAFDSGFDVIIDNPEIQIVEYSLPFRMPIRKSPPSAGNEYFEYEMPNDRPFLRADAPIEYDEADYGTDSISGLPLGEFGRTPVEVYYDVLPDMAYYPTTSSIKEDWWFVGTCRSVFASLVGMGTIVNGVNTPPENVGDVFPESNWVFDKMVGNENFQLPRYLRKYPLNGIPLGGVNSNELINTMWVNSGSATALSPALGYYTIDYINNKTVEDFTVGLVYKRTRKLKDVILFLLNKINPAITTDANSFNYIDTYQGDSLTFDGVTSNKSFENLSLGQITDFIPNTDGTQKDGAAIVGLISWNTLMNQLNEHLSLKYKVVNNVFSLVHYTEFSTTGLNQDYANFNGVNYLRRGNQIENEQPEYDNIKNNFKGNSVDFFSGNMKFPTLAISKDITVSSNVIFTDLDDILRAKSDSYDVESTNQFVLLALQEANGKFYLRNPNGLTSGESSNNSELSFVNLATNVLSDLPNSTAEINGISTNIAQNRLSKLNKASFQVPLKIMSEIDFLKGVEFFGNVAEFESVKKKIGQNIAECEIKFANGLDEDIENWDFIDGIDFEFIDSTSINFLIE